MFLQLFCSCRRKQEWLDWQPSTRAACSRAYRRGDVSGAYRRGDVSGAYRRGDVSGASPEPQPSPNWESRQLSSDRRPRAHAPRPCLTRRLDLRVGRGRYAAVPAAKAGSRPVRGCCAGSAGRRVSSMWAAPPPRTGILIESRSQLHTCRVARDVDRGQRARAQCKARCGRGMRTGVICVLWCWDWALLG